MDIDVFWFKRDLRLDDNQALKMAVESSKKTLLFYIYEPSVWQDNHYDERHLTFVKESLADLNFFLKNHNLEILCIYSELLPFFDELAKRFTIHTIYSTQETGLDITYKRDIAFSKYCLEREWVWIEFQNNGVIRGLKNRKIWRKSWYDYMSLPIEHIDWGQANVLTSSDFDDFEEGMLNFLGISSETHNFQKGGRTNGLKWKKSFFKERVEYYSTYISKPEMARYGCSRLSPYFAWGNLSIREVYQEAIRIKRDSKHKRQLNAFTSRLRWQSHFIQKFEMEPRMEFEAVNRGFLDLEQPLNNLFIEKWTEGKTGYPLVDASLRCVAKTGYINFRMRSMVTSFLTHHLFQHFTTGGAWLARQFLDFEPGIHYGQMQMQAGFTGTNTVRVYNPVKNAYDHDSEAIFIKKYVPELRDLPTNLAIEPWNITAMEEQLYKFEYGKDYPERIVDTVETRKVAVQKLYGQRKSELSKNERKRILERHTIPRKNK